MAKAFVNDATAVATPFLLILDDYHFIHSSEINAAMAFLLDHMPPHMHLVITSRTDPPLPLPRLRARRQLTEIRAADLRLTEAETAVSACGPGRRLVQVVSHPTISKLLTAFADENLDPSSSPTVPPLTARERQTLQLLATGQTIPEIAQELVVAVSTIRTYCKRIYSKLAVHSRAEAVYRAQVLGIL